jgi:hypothetical protein
MFVMFVDWYSHLITVISLWAYMIPIVHWYVFFAWLKEPLRRGGFGLLQVQMFHALPKAESDIRGTAS